MTSDFSSDAYVVAFVDLLGTGEKNRQIMAAVKEAGGDIAAAEPLLRKQVDQVRRFRADFTNFVQSIGRIEEQSMLRQLAPALTGQTVRINHFSDSLIIHAPIGTRNDRETPMEPCFKIMLGLTAALLGALARGAPFRGGIEVAPAASFRMEDGRDDVLGPALSCAYDLEANKAQWPRVVIGDTLSQQVASHLSPSMNSSEAGINKQLAQRINGLVLKTDEGIEILDVFGSTFRDMQPDEKVYWELISRARDFARKEAARLRDARGDEAARLSQRYQTLCGYLEGKPRLA